MNGNTAQTAHATSNRADVPKIPTVRAINATWKLINANTPALAKVSPATTTANARKAQATAAVTAAEVHTRAALSTVTAKTATDLRLSLKLRHASTKTARLNAATIHTVTSTAAEANTANASTATTKTKTATAFKGQRLKRAILPAVSEAV